MERITTTSGTFAIGGISSSADSFVVAESFVFRINIGGKKPAYRKSTNRFAKSETRNNHFDPFTKKNIILKL
jgi:hypothetical protein